MLLADVVLYLFGEDVARHVDALAAYDAAERDAGDFRRAAADVDDHVPFGRFHVEPCAERRRHRFVYHVHFPAAGVFGRFADGTYFHVRGTRRDADDHAQRRAEEVTAHLDLFYHAPEHQFRGVEIGDDAVLERTDGADVLVRLAVHLLGLFADGHHLAGMDVHGDDGRFVHDHLAVI